MQGIVVSTPGNGTGIIRGDDGRRYAYDLADWTSEGGPRDGLKVDFEPEGGRATRILRLPGQGLDQVMTGLAEAGAAAGAVATSAATAAGSAASEAVQRWRSRAAASEAETGRAGSSSILQWIGVWFERLLGLLAWMNIIGWVLAGGIIMFAGKDLIGGFSFLAGIGIIFGGLLVTVILFGFISILVAMRQHLGSIEQLLRERPDA